MQERTWTHIDKSAWGQGAWNNEPDKAQWTDAETGLPCLAVRGPHGGWCGYVGVADDHPLFGIGCSSCSLPTAQTRGVRESDLVAPDGFPALPASFVKRQAEKLVCGEDYCDHTPESMFDVHGGITFSDYCQAPREHGADCKSALPPEVCGCNNVGICHVPDKGEPERVFWYGFDCAHAGDLSPSHRIYSSDGDAYRTLDYVKAQCHSLAVQLKQQ